MIELPLVIDTKNKDGLKVFKPTDGQPLIEGEILITVAEDLEKLYSPILTKLYNQANPGLNINAFKPGTVIKFCLPSLIKLATQQVTPVKTEKTGTPDVAGTISQSMEGTVTEKKEKKSATPRKRDTPDRYRKGDKELVMREGSLRKQAYDTALTTPDKLDQKLKGVVSWLVRVGVLIREA